MKRQRILWCSDLVTPTGFSRVAHSVIKYLTKDFDIFGLGVNYYGDPHSYPYPIFPASLGGDVYGINRLEGLISTVDPDIIFILNDIWVIDPYLRKIKEIYKGKQLPKIVIYFPIDAEEHNSSWYSNLDIVTKAFTYTEFAKKVALKACPSFEFGVIPHGVESKDFYKLDLSREEVKRKVYPDIPEYINDSFIVLSTQRNQPRKRLDITMEGFTLFAKNKPDNVKLYMHCGIQDSAVNIVHLARRFDIEKRLIVSNLDNGVQKVSIERLNLIYNATDVGINSSLGEGWSLGNIEHASTGAPQVVADHSALHDLYEDCGILVPTVTKFTMDNIMTVGRLVTPEGIAEGLTQLYTNPELYNSLSTKSLLKFTSTEYSWEEIANTWAEVFKNL